VKDLFEVSGPVRDDAKRDTSRAIEISRFVPLDEVDPEILRVYEKLGIPIEEQKGAYPSPTILVDGMDVMGRPEAVGASCRLDMPTRERVLAALQAAATHRT